MRLSQIIISTCLCNSLYFQVDIFLRTLEGELNEGGMWNGHWSGKNQSQMNREDQDIRGESDTNQTYELQVLKLILHLTLTEKGWKKFLLKSTYNPSGSSVEPALCGKTPGTDSWLCSVPFLFWVYTSLYTVQCTTCLTSTYIQTFLSKVKCLQDRTFARLWLQEHQEIWTIAIFFRSISHQ